MSTNQNNQQTSPTITLHQHNIHYKVQNPKKSLFGIQKNWIPCEGKLCYDGFQSKLILYKLKKNMTYEKVYDTIILTVNTVIDSLCEENDMALFDLHLNPSSSNTNTPQGMIS